MADVAKTRERTAPSAPLAPDRAGSRLLIFVGGLALALIVGFGVGRWAGPVNAPKQGGGMNNGGVAGTAGAGHDDGHSHGGPTGGNVAGASSADQVGGLSLSTGGYTLVPAFEPGKPFRFRIDGPDRKPVTNFAVVHDKSMHLVVVRRDLSGYQHLHPTMAADGTWSVDLVLPQPGVWRAYTDFAAVGANGAQVAVTLGTDLTMPGAYQPRALPAPARESTVDTFTVTYEGTPQIGATQPLLFRVFTSGQPVKDLERYLGAFGHLVVLRDGDLGYVHVHPEEQLAGTAVKFWLAAPSPGRYRMFFDFQVAGKVHTAEYTMVVP